ncbi:hypothetical protein [Asticcacaulis sp. 201]|uniref:hypothetical protein n=1 Tax=Asticcacaulis sp. 201 TaxID=3028787 RepID=UPI0029168743|nr:hypothetical protein [Asticcacaulis sp. 201]MDV6331806.1 hypothetical protein [Asticcacaulis sp. 201]
MIRPALYPALLLLCLAACSRAPTPASPADVSAGLPPDQAALIALPHEIKAKVSDPGQQTDQFCAQFKKYDTFSGWRGTVKDLRISTIDGTADLEIDIGRSIRLEAIIPKTDPVYGSLSGLTLGTPITVTGRFTHANNDADCLYYFGPFGVRLSALASH